MSFFSKATSKTFTEISVIFESFLIPVTTPVMSKGHSRQSSTGHSFLFILSVFTVTILTGGKASFFCPNVTAECSKLCWFPGNRPNSTRTAPQTDRPVPENWSIKPRQRAVRFSPSHPLYEFSYRQGRLRGTGVQHGDAAHTLTVHIMEAGGG